MSALGFVGLGVVVWCAWPRLSDAVVLVGGGGGFLLFVNFNSYAYWRVAGFRVLLVDVKPYFCLRLVES